ncbi:hypothetical protein BGZ61DRAFT_517296 [Ilyonectria robusta]|uniref:uncharacterized protein n=1 Tax=Ilyonectria robusta TaxID=1079257 RepID=UPI001E8E946A|nr:uncharacterized protein BGZ61DRAFT_517296 [Ilyonectria robusta]KAH8706695.1 hypothetical protein BGZ61DRAFT_517296 [Ilyonectria robusta]
MQEAKEHLGRRPVLVLVLVLLLARSEPKALPCLTPPEPDTMDRVCARGSACVCVCVAMYSVQVWSRTRHRDPGPLENPGGRIRRRADVVLVGGGRMGHRPLDPLCASSAPEDFQRAVVGYSGFQRVSASSRLLRYVGLEPPATASHHRRCPCPWPSFVSPERAMLPLRS